jgi:drug/metabolite transporter (DMT)-like permease
MPQSALRPYLWMLLGAASFAVMSILTVALRDLVAWQWIAIARTGLAMIFALLLALAGGAKLVFLRPAKLWMRSLAGSVSLLCGFYALTHYTASEVVTLTNMFPLWVTVLSLPLLGQYPPRDVWPAVIVGILGVALIQQQPLAGTYVAIAAALLSSFTSAIALIGLHRLREIDPRAVVAHFSAVALAGCVVALFVFPRTGPLLLKLTPASAVMLLGVGLFATIGQLFLTKAFAAGPPARVSVVCLSQIGFTMLLEMVIWRRSFNAATLLGIGLVIAPTAWTLLRGSPVVAEELVEEHLTIDGLG